MIGIEITPEQLEVIREALGDARAYRSDSGELAQCELEPEDLGPYRRYVELAKQLGVELDY